MDHASLTDTNGRVVSFKQIILIMTTNTGSRERMKHTLGFDKAEYEDKSGRMIERFFSPEFRNRLTGIVHFNALELKIVERIVDKIMRELADRLKAKKVVVKLDPKARTYLAKKGYNPQLGARPIQRLIDKLITKRLSREILFGKLSSGGMVTIKVVRNKLKFEF
jgi:ATP-dependent Clp protease ATP-binding subunit ClpA